VLVASWRDLNGDGQLQVGELSNEGLGAIMNPGDLANLLVVFEIPGAAANGAVTVFGVNARSFEDPTNAFDLEGNLSTAIVVDDSSLQVRKEASTEVASPGDTVNFTIEVQNVG